MVADITNPYYDLHRVAGQEVSSTGEGRHVLFKESDLIHAPGSGLVQKGQPVAFWDGVGIALKTAQAATDVIPVDTEGIWRVSVQNTGINPFGTIKVGQVLFIDSAGIVYDDWQTSFAIFGYAMQEIDSVRTEVISVKVHWMYPYWYYDERIDVIEAWILAHVP